MKGKNDQNPLIIHGLKFCPGREKKKIILVVSSIRDCQGIENKGLGSARGGCQREH